MNTQLAELFDKCRCCHVPLANESNAVKISEKFVSDYFDVIGVNLIASNCSQHVCKRCFCKVGEFHEFKAEMLEKQMTLNRLIEESIKEEVFVKIEEKDESYDEPNCFESLSLSYELVRRTPTTKPKRVLKDRKKYQKKVKDDSVDPFTCPICGKFFKNKRTVKTHIQRLHQENNKFISCDRCGYCCYSRTEIQAHMKNNHLPKVEDPSILRVCPHCAKVEKGNNRLTFHIKKFHLKLVKFSCDKCPFQTYGRYELRRHFEIHHLPLWTRKNFPCDVPGCTSVVTTARSLEVHKKLKHSLVKNFVCTFCGKSYALKHQLKNHIRYIHEGDKPFRCGYENCNKRFMFKRQLEIHDDRAHKGITEERVTCEICQKTFTSKNHFQSHMKYHKDPQFDCTYCSKKFYFKPKRDLHEETVHLGKTFNCDSCDKKFGSTSGLRRHHKTRH